MTAPDKAPLLPEQSPEEPEHRSDRRRFLVWGVLAGFVPPERLTERIVDELRHETVGAQ